MTTNTNLNKLLSEASGLIKAKEFDRAIPIYESALKIDSMSNQALSHLGIIYLMKGRYQDAVDMIHKSIELEEPVIGDYENLAIAYRALKDYKNLIYVYEKIVQINSNNSKIYKLLGDTQLKIWDLAGANNSYQKALELEPAKFQQNYDYGLILYHLNFHEKALKQLRKAHKIDPSNLPCMHKIAGSLSAIGDYNEARSIYKKLQKLLPDTVGPYIDYATTLIHEGKYEEPVKLLKECLEKKSHNLIKTNLAILYLGNKKFKEGWEQYGARLLERNEQDPTKRHDKLKGYFDIDLDKKKLMPNENILILLEGGIGDVILGLSMLKDFHKRFKKISAEVDYRLVNLCKRSFPEIDFYEVRDDRCGELFIKHDLSLFDKGIYWGSIGSYVREKISDFPKEKRVYLNIDNNKDYEIKNKLNKGGEITCGIAWKSWAKEGRHKATQLKKLLPILSLNGIKFIDLQYEAKINLGATALEKEELFIKHNIAIEDYEGIDKFDDIEGVAALISNCDIVVTCSNVTAHIAGALGKKTFLFLPFGRGKLWYWHDEGGKSIWYPSIKIFTADSPGEWGELFNEIANAIKQDLIN